MADFILVNLSSYMTRENEIDVADLIQMIESSKDFFIYKYANQILVKFVSNDKESISNEFDSIISSSNETSVENLIRGLDTCDSFKVHKFDKNYVLINLEFIDRK